MCKMPEILHKGVCTRTTEAGTIDYKKLFKSWDIFRSKMELIRKEQEDEEEKTKKDSDLLAGITKIAEAQNVSMAAMIEAFKGSNRGTTKLVKPAKVPGWTKEMKLEVCLKGLEVWMETNKDISEGVKYQDVIESLKNNKEIEGLQQYVGEHILTKLDMVEKQKVKQITELLKLRYGRTRIEELEALMEDRIKFDANEHDNEDEYLFAMEILIARK